MLRRLRRRRKRRVHEALVEARDYHEVLVEGEPNLKAEAVVASHWVVYVKWGLEALASFVFLWLFLQSPTNVAWLPLVIFFGLLGHAVVSALSDYMDVLVISEIRIFRITGLVVSRRASMPLSRLLDITVNRPFLGAILDYGHFTFESAAQTQGMKDVRFVPHPFHYEKLIILNVHKSSGRTDGRPRPGARSG